MPRITRHRIRVTFTHPVRFALHFLTWNFNYNCYPVACTLVEAWIFHGRSKKLVTLITPLLIYALRFPRCIHRVFCAPTIFDSDSRIARSERVARGVDTSSIKGRFAPLRFTEFIIESIRFSSPKTKRVQ